VKANMAKTKHHPQDEAERELIQALKEMPQRAGPREICPTPDLLQQFVSGLVNEEATRNRILAHLDVCPKCLDVVVQLRNVVVQLRNRRIRIRRAAMALVAVVLIAAVLWIWPIKPSLHSVSVGIVDLSVAGPTRSNHHIDMPTVKVGADTRQIRVVLPKVSADDMYEIAVLKGEANGKPILQNAASPTMLDHNPEIRVDMDFSQIPPGSYLLGIRHGDSNWEYVPLVRE
jgi:hypothetical protein